MTPRHILLAGAAALLPALMSGAVAQASAEAPADRFTPPNAPLTLTRTLYRSLADGKQVIVTRRYAIRFSPEGDGYRLDGELLTAEVEAPPLLAGMAEIERKRPDTGLFPARLDSHGMIRGEIRGIVDPQTRRTAIGGADALIARSRMAPDSKRESVALVDQVANASNGTSWPRFLFNPGSGDRVESRDVALPDGSVGRIEVRVHADGLMPGGLAQRVERIVTTRLTGTVRTTREVWTLTP